MGLFGFGGRGREDDERVEPDLPRPAEGDQALLRAAPFASYRLGGGNEALQLDGGGPPLVVAGFFADVLRRCRSFETLDEHVLRLSEDLRFDRAEAASLRESLVEAAESGLLRSLASVREEVAARAAAEDPVPISAVGLVTRDRVECVSRSLRSYMEHARAFGRRMDFVVCDDSRTPEAGARCAAEAESLAREFGFDVYYAGPGEKRTYASALAEEVRAHVPGADELVRFGLSGTEELARTTGANRNVLHLHCAGGAYFSSDDDILCQVAPSPEAREGLVLSSTDPTEFRFYRSVPEALAEARFQGVDVWAEHERILGRSLDHVVAGESVSSSLDLDAMDDELFRRLLSGGSTVRVTSTGIVGDSGMGKAPYLLFLGGETLERLREDEDAYGFARSTRAVARAAPSLTVSDSVHLMAGAVAVDGRALLPPFMPVLRNADGVFVQTTRTCVPDALAGHVPWTIRHEPPVTRAFAEDEVVNSISALRCAEYVLRWSQHGGFGPGERDPEVRLQALGRHFQGLGRLPVKDLEALLVSEQRVYLSDLGAVLEHRLGLGELPPTMARDAERCLDHIEACITGAPMPAPVDLLEGRAAAAAMALFSRILGAYGRLLESWPAMVEAAGALRQRGVSPGRLLG